MGTPIIYGTPFSTYVRTVRMCLAEKPAAYELVDVAVLAGEHKQPAHLARHPFGTVPAFEHDGFPIYETSAIIRYVDQVFPGRTLTPADPRERARMNMVISIVDYHAYPSMIGKIAINRIFTSLAGGVCDEQAVADAVPKAALCCSEFQRLMGDGPFLAGAEPSLADFYVVPVLHYLDMTPEKKVISNHPRLARWWGRINERESVRRTVPQL
jgi:glutathione S-transferase